MLVLGNETEQRFIALHLDQCAILRQQRDGGRWLQSNGRFLDLPLWIIGRGFHLNSRNLLDVLRFTSDSDPPICLGIDHRAVGYTSS